jgi:alpha-beta hydrolase superfamily lysophospholipase
MKTAMRHGEEKIRTRDGVDLHVERWTPERVRCVVAIAHGGAEHIGRYDHVARALGEIGALVFGHDHRGQGRSGGPRGHVEDFAVFTSDLRHVVSRVGGSLPAEQRPGAVPWFLFGHSMGGLITLLYLAEQQGEPPLRGAVISAPFLELAMRVNPLKLGAARLAARLLPRMSFTTGLPPDGISRDPREVAKYAEDPVRVDTVTARFVAASEEARALVLRVLPKITLPMLWYAGSGDTIVSYPAIVQAFDRLVDPAANDQRFHTFDGYYHELHNEPAALREPVFELVRAWVEERIADDSARSRDRGYGTP